MWNDCLKPHKICNFYTIEWQLNHTFVSNTHWQYSLTNGLGINRTNLFNLLQNIKVVFITQVYSYCSTNNTHNLLAILRNRGDKTLVVFRWFSWVRCKLPSG